MSSFTLLAGSSLAAEGGKSLYDRAMDYYYAGNYEKAAELLKEYVKEHPDPKAYFRIGYSLYKLGRHDEADEYFEQSYLVSPGYSPTPELEEKHKRLKDVRPEGYYEGRIKEQPAEKKGAVKAPEGYMAVEKPSTLAVPKEQVPEEAAQPTEETAPPAEEAAPPVAEEPAPPLEEAAPPMAEETAPPLEEAAPPVAEELAPPLEEAAPPAASGPAPPVDELAPPASELPIPFEMSEKQAILAAIAMLSAFLIPLAIVLGLLYLIFSFSLFKISGKLGLGRAASILSWVPLLQAFPMTWAAGKSTLWGIIFVLASLFLGPIGLIIGIYFWMCIAENLGRSKMVGLLMLVPVINILLPLFLAFTGVAQTGVAAAGGGDAFGDISGEPSLDLPDVPDDFDDLDFAEPDFSEDEGASGADEFDDVDDFSEEPDMTEPEF